MLAGMRKTCPGFRQDFRCASLSFLLLPVRVRYYGPLKNTGVATLYKPRSVRKIWCGFAEEGGCEGGHGCKDARGSPAAMRATATFFFLKEGGCLSGSGPCLVADEGRGLVAQPAPDFECKHHQIAPLVVEEL